MTRLNPRQLEAVRTTDVPLLVLAGAGSGKTRVITEKIAYLVRSGLPARQIAAVTFTNKAAREMRERVNALLSGDASRGLRVSTFHALGLDLLRREYKALGFKSSLSIFDEYDRATVLKALLEDHADGLPGDRVEHYAQRISTWKNQFETPAAALNTAEDDDRLIATLYDRYERQMKAYNAVDFDDLIYLPVRLLESNAEVREQWRNRIRYLLVDEYQDTNLTQYQLLRELSGNLGHFTVVGDDDQSIYAWRGARPDNFRQLQADYPRLRVIKLEQNYRSTARILRVANQLIANNPHVFEKRLWSELGQGDPLRVLSHPDDEAEARQVASDIVHHRFRVGGSWCDYAVLYRSNHQSRLIERALREFSVPYAVSGGQSFFAHVEVKDVLAYVRLLANPDDDPAFLRVVNTPRREIGSATLEKLGEYAKRRHISLFDACHEVGLAQFVTGAALDRLRNFADWIADVADRAERGDTWGVIRDLIDTVDYKQWLKDSAVSERAAERKIANVEELLAWMQRTAEQDDGKTLAEVVNRMMLLDILDRQQDAESGDRVSLMTLHAAKGLEFRYVHLVGMEENLLPHQNAIALDDVEEERRLAYVGITRAQQGLTFSFCQRRRRQGEATDCEPSRFLNELPADDLEWPQRQGADPELSKQRGQEALAGLRGLLAAK